MNLIYLLLFSVSIISSSLDAGPLEDKVKQIIQDIKDNIPEPIRIPNSNITIPENGIISGNFNLSDCVANGLKEMELSVKFITIIIVETPTEFSFKLKDLQIHTGYQMNIPIFNIAILTLFGSGNLSLSLSGLSIAGKINPLSFRTKLFSNVISSIDDAKLNITGFLDDSRFSKDLSNDLSNTIIAVLNNEEFGKLLEKGMNSLVASIINRNKTQQINYTRNDLSVNATGEQADIFGLLNASEKLIGDLLQLLFGN